VTKLVERNTGQSPAVSLYSGKVMHARLKPVGHRFTYSVCSMLIDLDRLAEAASASSLFSVNRFNVVAFHERDHGPRDGTPLRDHVDRLMRNAGLPRPARVELLCYPSVLGYTFNPLAVYFCRDEAGAVVALVYQVHNTFGESHTYVEPVLPGQQSPAGIRQDRSKGFYVSPFLEMDLTYHFRIRPPDKEVALRILETDAEGPILAATFHGVRQQAGTVTFLAAVLKTLGIPWKVIVGIHLEAARIWLKGIRLQARPKPPAPESYSGLPGPGAGLAPGE
jgi:DUF1365 family protein